MSSRRAKSRKDRATTLAAEAKALTSEGEALKVPVSKAICLCSIHASQVVVHRGNCPFESATLTWSNLVRRSTHGNCIRLVARKARKAAYAEKVSACAANLEEATARHKSWTDEVRKAEGVVRKAQAELKVLKAQRCVS